MTDFRALCAELLKALEYEAGAASDDWAMLRVKAGAALAQPKPPNLKERSLKHLEIMERDGHYLPEILQDLRRAVEQLDA